jgi:hypothetical protein
MCRADGETCISRLEASLRFSLTTRDHVEG